MKHNVTYLCKPSSIIFVHFPPLPIMVLRDDCLSQRSDLKYSPFRSSCPFSSAMICRLPLLAVLSLSTNPPTHSNAPKKAPTAPGNFCFAYALTQPAVASNTPPQHHVLKSRVSHTHTGHIRFGTFRLRNSQFSSDVWISAQRRHHRTE